MDDEEEDVSRPVSQTWGTPFMEVKYEDSPSPSPAGRPSSDTMAGSVSSGDNEEEEEESCRMGEQPSLFCHGTIGFRLHFPAQFEPTADRGERQEEEEEEEEEDGREEERRAVARPEGEASPEVRIGRKLREIGDHFHQEHVELFLRHQREQLPAWMRLTTALLDFLFPRELRGEGGGF
ncbi:bcl-2-modifying factor-like [Aplochiton taeniatus]